MSMRGGASHQLDSYGVALAEVSHASGMATDVLRFPPANFESSCPSVR